MIPLLDDNLYSAFPDIFNLKYLHYKPMASLNLYYKDKIPEIPNAHVALVGSKYQLTFIDVTQIWKKYHSQYPGGTILNIVASDFEHLVSFDDETVKKAIKTELEQYITEIARHPDTEREYLQKNTELPLFMNYVGSWIFRPDPNAPVKTRPACEWLSNLYLAGDYCQTNADLACMEGAVEAGLRAAKAIQKDMEGESEIEILPLQSPNSLLLIVLKCLVIPLVPLFLIGSKIIQLIYFLFGIKPGTQDFHQKRYQINGENPEYTGPILKADTLQP